MAATTLFLSFLNLIHNRIVLSRFAFLYILLRLRICFLTAVVIQGGGGSEVLILTFLLGIHSAVSKLYGQ